MKYASLTHSRLALPKQPHRRSVLGYETQVDKQPQAGMGMGNKMLSEGKKKAKKVTEKGACQCAAGQNGGLVKPQVGIEHPQPAEGRPSTVLHRSSLAVPRSGR